MTEPQHLSLLRNLLILSMVSTAIHFTDNYMYLEQYPQPDWISRAGVIQSWVLWTAAGIAGYLLYRSGRIWLSYACLAIYSTCGLSSLAHYLFGGLEEFTPKMHFFILTDGLSGILILGFILWAIWNAQKRQPVDV